MASIVRPSMLHQSARLSNPAKRLLYTLTPSAAIRTASKSQPSLLQQQGVRNAFVKSMSPKTIGVAAFHASGRQAILPAQPQKIEGTVNDPAPLPHHSPSHGSYHWTFERATCVALVPLMAAPFAAGSLNPTTDALLCALILIHSHIGFGAIITDYIPPRHVPKSRVFFDWLLRIGTVAVGVGLYEFETNDVGVTEAVKRIWKA